MKRSLLTEGRRVHLPALFYPELKRRRTVGHTEEGASQVTDQLPQAGAERTSPQISPSRERET